MKTQLSRRKFIKAGILITAGALLAEAFWLEKYFFDVNEFFAPGASPKAANIKVLQVSDLHLRYISYAHRKLANKINQINPDLIVFTGDSVDRRKNTHLLDDFLKLIQPEIPKAAIVGNWECWKSDIDTIREIYKSHNCRLLINDSMQFELQGKTISITGLDDFIGGYPHIGHALREYKPSDYHIILNHCPEYSETIAAELDQNIPVDFILSGHTHGGQVNLFGFAPVLPRGSGRFVKGWYNDISPKMYVSKGVGTNIIPVRLGARAEIAVFYLKG